MNVKAGALAMEVFKRNPNHPGAVHYIIHAFDDPVHAPLALEAAKVYAKIVPAVSHAVHMPTHIFIQHGMWNEVANQNIRAFNVGEGAVAARRRARRHVAFRRLGPVRLPAAWRLRRRARAHPGLRVDGRDDQERARDRRARAGARPLHHRNRRVEGAARCRQRLERNDPRQRIQRREDRRHGDGGEDGGAAGGEGEGRRPAARRPANPHADHGARARSPRRAAGGAPMPARASRVMHKSSPRSSRRRKGRPIRRSRC